MESPQMMDRKETAAVRLPWHKPELRHIRVNLDTRNEPGSGADELTFGPLVGQ